MFAIWKIGAIPERHVCWDDIDRLPQEVSEIHLVWHLSRKQIRVKDVRILTG
jgi:hypothetical protein